MIMIDITLDMIECKARIQGHADSAPKGEDLVCAAVTILCHTMARECERLEALHYAKCEYSVEEGYASFDIRALDCKAGMMATEAFAAICGGFKEIAERAPQYVNLRKK